jgi:hypothetical protein
MSKHTPGPWAIEEPMGDIELSIVESGKKSYEWRFIACIPLSTTEQDPPEFSREEVDANARLIVVCPEMVSALLRFLARDRAEMYYKQPDLKARDKVVVREIACKCGCCKEARAVLAKAGIEEPADDGAPGSADHTPAELAAARANAPGMVP